MHKMQKDLQQPSREILEAAGFILSGGIGAVPTETVYGLASDALNPSAARKIFEAKGRPFIDPLIVHVIDIEMAEKVAVFDGDSRRLAEKFWPGPFTMVLPRREIIDDIVTAGLDTVAVRMPSHPVMRSLIAASGRPLVAPSANPFGYVSPTTAAHVREQLGGKIDFILDGGPCECGVESTILLTTSSPKKLLRPGPISPDQIEEALGEAIDRSPKKNEAHPQAPGMLNSHYSPKSRLKLFKNESEIPADFRGEVIFVKRPANPLKNHYWLSESGDLREAAHNLFALLRSLDKVSVNGMYCQIPKKEGIGLALFDRLSRAETKMQS